MRGTGSFSGILFRTIRDLNLFFALGTCDNDDDELAFDLFPFDFSSPVPLSRGRFDLDEVDIALNSQTGESKALVAESKVEDGIYFGAGGGGTNSIFFLIVKGEEH